MLAIGCKACCAAVPENASGSVTVKEHRWGERLADLGGPFDVIDACGVLLSSLIYPCRNLNHVHVLDMKLIPAFQGKVCMYFFAVHQVSLAEVQT